MDEEIACRTSQHHPILQPQKERSINDFYGFVHFKKRRILSQTSFSYFERHSTVKLASNCEDLKIWKREEQKGCQKIPHSDCYSAPPQQKIVQPRVHPDPVALQPTLDSRHHNGINYNSPSELLMPQSNIFSMAKQTFHMLPNNHTLYSGLTYPKNWASRVVRVAATDAELPQPFDTEDPSPYVTREFDRPQSKPKEIPFSSQAFQSESESVATSSNDSDSEYYGRAFDGPSKVRLYSVLEDLLLLSLGKAGIDAHAEVLARLLHRINNAWLFSQRFEAVHDRVTKVEIYAIFIRLEKSNITTLAKFHLRQYSGRKVHWTLRESGIDPDIDWQKVFDRFPQLKDFVHQLMKKWEDTLGPLEEIQDLQKLAKQYKVKFCKLYCHIHGQKKPDSPAARYAIKRAQFESSGEADQVKGKRVSMRGRMIVKTRSKRSQKFRRQRMSRKEKPLLKTKRGRPRLNRERKLSEELV